MCAGVLLHRFGTVDEYDLHGRGREIPVVGVLMGIGALLLAAAPPSTAFAGKSLLESASSEAGNGWLVAVFVIVSALTGGAVLRVTGRVFLGWGPSAGPDRSQARAAEERVNEEHGPRDRTPLTMVVVPAVLLGLGARRRALPRGGAGGGAGRRTFRRPPGLYPWVLGSARRKLAARGPEPRGDDRRTLFGCSRWPAQLAVATLGLFGRSLRRIAPAGRSETPLGRSASDCAKSSRGISATTSPGGPPAPACWRSMPARAHLTRPQGQMGLGAPPVDSAGDAAPITPDAQSSAVIVRTV